MSGKLIIGGGALSVSDVVAHACGGADGGLAIDAALLARLAGGSGAASAVAGPAAAVASGHCDALARAAHTGGLAQLCAVARGGVAVRGGALAALAALPGGKRALCGDGAANPRSCASALSRPWSMTPTALIAAKTRAARATVRAVVI